MTEDLKMTGDDYNVALFTFFITYILFEVRLPIRILKCCLHGKHTASTIQAHSTTLPSHGDAMLSQHR